MRAKRKAPAAQPAPVASFEPVTPPDVSMVVKAIDEAVSESLAREKKSTRTVRKCSLCGAVDGSRLWTPECPMYAVEVLEEA